MQTQAVQSEIKAPPSKALDDLLQKTAEHKGCGTQGGSGKASCGSAAGQGDLPAEIWEKGKKHPCYNGEAHHHYARLHVAGVAPPHTPCNHFNPKKHPPQQFTPPLVTPKPPPPHPAHK